MASYLQWRKAAPRRITWLCGNPVLAAEAVQRIRDLAPAGHFWQSLTAGEAPDRDVWDAAAQLAAPGENRLVLVRSAQRLRSAEPLREIASTGRDGAGSWLVLWSDEDGYYQRDAKTRKTATDNMGRKILQPGPAAVQAASCGQLVRCALSSEADQIAWVQEKLPGLSPGVAWRVIARSGGNLAAASSLREFLSLWPPEARTEALVGGLAVQDSQDEFTELLVTGRKDAAMRVIPPPDDLGGVLGMLGSLLDNLARLHDASLQQFSVRDCVKEGIPQVVAVKYRVAAKDYPPDRILSCRMLLARADSAWRGGAREGVAEVVAALW